MLKRTWKHLGTCIDVFFEERIAKAKLLQTEKGRATALAKAKESRMSSKAIRECLQLSAWSDFPQRVVEVFEQKRNPTIPIALETLKYTYQRNNEFINGERSIHVTDVRGKVKDISYSECENVVQIAARLFNLEMEDRFLELSDIIPTFLCSACIADPRQKGTDLDKKSHTKGRNAIIERLNTLLALNSYKPVKPKESNSSDEDDTYASWDNGQSDLSRSFEENELKNSSIVDDEDGSEKFVPLTASDIIDQYLTEARLGEQASRTKARRVGLLMDLTKPKWNFLRWAHKQYIGQWSVKVGKQSIVPSQDQKIVRKMLITVLCSFLGGHISTAVQESVFSLAAMAEGGARNSRSHALNLSRRVFLVANKEWLTPVEGSRARVSDLKRRGIPVSKRDVKPRKVQKKL